MKIEHIEKISEYLAIVESISADIRRSNSDELLLFRGQNSDKPLLPKIAREYETIRDFGNPYLYDPFTFEVMMLEDFKRRSRPYLTQEPSSDLDWLTIAQHHGMNTRLLDWTENPLVGLFFALQPIRANTDRVIWILRIGRKEIIAPTKTLKPFELSRTRLFMPNIVSPRLVTQAGWFTIHKRNEKKDKFIALENNTAYKKLLTKVVIKNNFWNIVDLMKHLDLCGVNSSSLFVDLDGLCKHINLKKDLHNRYHIRMPEAKKKTEKI
jgi:hypothetical protein